MAFPTLAQVARIPNQLLERADRLAIAHLPATGQVGLINSNFGFILGRTQMLFYQVRSVNHLKLHVFSYSRNKGRLWSPSQLPANDIASGNAKPEELNNGGAL